MQFRIFVQARMSSTRFPGKMLAPFRGRPLIGNVLERLERAGLRAQTIVLTSNETSDDPLADYVERRCGTPVFRGELDNVLGRFQACLRTNPCDWFVRISGDSPLMDGGLVRQMTTFIDSDIDVVSNVVKRTFPAGQSVECVRSEAFAALDPRTLTADQREHATTVFYGGTSRWRLRSIICADPQWAGRRLVVDEVSDLRAVAAFADSAAGRALALGPLARSEG